jgi:hypothetical protein
MSKEFNKKIFSILLDMSRGSRSWRQFAIDCDISYVQMRKLAFGTQENPPRLKLVRKVAQNARGEIGLDELTFAAGINTIDASAQEPVAETPIDKYRSLAPKDRKTVERFIEFLAEDSKKTDNEL